MKTIVVCAIIALVAALDVYSQSPEEMNIVQNIWGLQKRELMTAALKLNAKDSAAFWPIYDQYETKRKELGLMRYDKLKKFVEKFPKISDKEIDDAVNDAISMEKKFEELIADYYGTMKSKVNTMVAAKFFQIEKYIHTEVQTEIQSRLPFIGDFEKKEEAHEHK